MAELEEAYFIKPPVFWDANDKRAPVRKAFPFEGNKGPGDKTTVLLQDEISFVDSEGFACVCSLVVQQLKDGIEVKKETLKYDTSSDEEELSNGTEKRCLGELFEDEEVAEELRVESPAQAEGKKYFEAPFGVDDRQPFPPPQATSCTSPLNHRPSPPLQRHSDFCSSFDSSSLLVSPKPRSCFIIPHFAETTSPLSLHDTCIEPLIKGARITRIFPAIFSELYCSPIVSPPDSPPIDAALEQNDDIPVTKDSIPHRSHISSPDVRYPRITRTFPAIFSELYCSPPISPPVDAALEQDDDLPVCPECGRVKPET